MSEMRTTVNLEPTRFLDNGFKPFFLGGAVFGTLAIAIWLVLFRGLLAYQPAQLSPSIWHGHEMVFGFTGAIIAGFLLTAVRNWTSLPTLSHAPLAALVMLWGIARAMLLMPYHSTALLGLGFDIFFECVLIYVITRPIAARGQLRRQFPVLLGCTWLTLSNIGFWYALSNASYHQEHMALTSGVMAVVYLILVIAARVIPFFFSRRIVGYVRPSENSLLTLCSHALFMLFALMAIFDLEGILICILAFALATIHGAKLYGWLHTKVWQHPMTWILALGYLFIPLGFALYGLTVMSPETTSLALHTLTVGAIGSFCLGMMTRVSLGHSGLDIYSPPRGVSIAFALVASGAAIRVLMPLSWPEHYVWWITLAQLTWILSFGWFTVTYGPLLVGERRSKRVAGKPPCQP